MKTHLLFLNAVFLLVSCNFNKETLPQRKDITDAIFASGNTEYKNEYLVTANLEGYLNASLVSESDSVKPGQILFKLSNEIQQAQVKSAEINYQYAVDKLATNAPQIQQLQIQIAQAKEQSKTDSINFLRYERLVKTKAVSQADYEKVKLQFESSVSNTKLLQKSLADLKETLVLNSSNAQTQLNIQQQNNQYYTLSSSVKAIVLNVFKKNGDLVKKGETIAKLAAGTLIIKLFIAEEDIQRVEIGQNTVISLNTQKDKLYNAKITKIYPGFDEQLQSFIAEATFDQLPKNLMANTQLQANIILEEKLHSLIIPSAFLNKGDTVILKEGKKKIPVKVGIRNLAWVEILSGLTEKDKIIRTN